jgi:hypothetical protein
MATQLEENIWKYTREGSLKAGGKYEGERIHGTSFGSLIMTVTPFVKQGNY